MTRVRSNLDAIRTLRILEESGRPATADQQRVLARWSGWGAAPTVFDEDNEEFASERHELRALLSDADYNAASRTVLNAHYTDADIVREIWAAVEQLGFDGGRVLEPGCGSGTFLGMAPPDTDLVGVELDPTTAAIASYLYPDATILTESFADTQLREHSFDLVVGNVPFGKITLHDPRHNHAGHSIHNHFILKSLHLTRPGGLLALLTSRYTMDGQNPAARREMAVLADLVAAVRLPSAAHRRAAGTEVITDLMIFRRRAAGEPPRSESATWERSQEFAGNPEVRMNTYFESFPAMVLGRPRIAPGGGMYRRDDLQVEAENPAPEALRDALDQVVAYATDNELVLSPAADRDNPQQLVLPAVRVGASIEHRDGLIQATSDGFTQLVGDEAVEYRPPGTQADELRALLDLRDTAVGLLEAESSTSDETPNITSLRTQLNQQYDSYVARWGLLNRTTWRNTGPADPETGEQKQARVQPGQGGFRDDPYAPVVYALENLDETGNKATKAVVFSRRVIAPRTPRLGADTPADALAICLDSHGYPRLDVIADLLGTEPADARAALGNLVFDDPEHPGRLLPAADYLAGNVRDKLSVAWAAAEADPETYQANVDALIEVAPADLKPGDIEARLGASWIHATYVQQFARDLLRDPKAVVEQIVGANWNVRSENQHGVLATSTWGTWRYPSSKLLKALLEQRIVKVTDEEDYLDAEGKVRTRRVPNELETAAAQEKADAISDRFAEWLWEDDERATACAARYNELFNNLLLRSYDNVRLTLPGLADGWRPRDHQVAAVARIINEPAVLLAHEVGAGKTAEMCMGAMELRRLGLARKPAIVVPNHMLEQFSREFLQIYPRATILAAGMDDLRGDRRRRLVARVATGDWDAVILTRSAFERLPVSGSTRASHVEANTERLRQRLEEGAGSKTRKRVEAILLREEQRVKKSLDSVKDTGISFETTGIDYLFVDEAHAYKRLRTPSNTPGLGIPDGSKRAADLAMKLDYLRETTKSNRVVCFATATPITNTLAEIYVMQRYLRPDVLEQAGIDDFDIWAATFGKTVTSIEVAPEGTGFREHTRFARFVNVPELLRMFHVAADIKTAEDLDLDTPELAGGAAETVVIEPTDELTAYMESLADRAHEVRRRRVSPKQDNMLVITGDGRKAALDLALVDHEQGPPSKSVTAGEQIAAIYHAQKDTRYLDADGTPHPVPGALQIVFCDLSTPKDEWNVYDHLAWLLAEQGVPSDKIQYVQNHKKPAEKAALFEACRSGGVAVLIGSTETMGVGTNVQRRAVALHHMDCHWLPAMIAQREGRIVRQGNQNKTVQIHRYVTERSFDAYMWQTVQRKATFIAQVMRGRLDVRELDDIGDQALSYAEVKALATGNPLLLEKAEADAELVKLERLQRSHERNKNDLRRTIDSAEYQIGKLAEDIDGLDTAILRRQDISGDKFAMRIGQNLHTQRAVAGDHLKQAMTELVRAWTSTPLAQVGGFTLTVTRKGNHKGADHSLALADVPIPAMTLKAKDLGVDASSAGLVRRIEYLLTGLEDKRERAQQEAARYEQEIHEAQGQLGAPFPHTEELTEARARVASLDAQLTPDKDDEADDVGTTDNSVNPPEPDDPAVPPPAAAPGSSERSHVGVMAQKPDWYTQPHVGPDEPPTVHKDVGRVDVADPQNPSSGGGAASEAEPGTSDPSQADNSPASGDHQPHNATGHDEDSRPAVSDDSRAPSEPPSGPYLVHNHSGTRLLATTRDDHELRQALKSAGGWKWSRNQGFWYLPRNWHTATRTSKVQVLRAQLTSRGRTLPTFTADPLATTSSARTATPDPYFTGSRDADHPSNADVLSV